MEGNYPSDLRGIYRKCVQIFHEDAYYYKDKMRTRPSLCTVDLVYVASGVCDLLFVVLEVQNIDKNVSQYYKYYLDKGM